MSTKTTFKRIALVAVAALGLGVLSVAPSNAATSGLTVTVSKAGSQGNTAGTVADTSTASIISIDALTTADNDTISVTMIRKSAPSTGSAVRAHFAFVDTGTVSTAVASLVSSVSGMLVATTPDSKTAVTTEQSAGYIVSGSAGYKTARFGILFDTNTAPAAGSYVYTIVAQVYSGLGAYVSQTTADLTVTVAALASASTTIAPGSSTAFINSGTTTNTLADSSVAVVATAATTTHATINVITKNANGNEAPESVTATLTGPGLVCTDAGTCGKSLTIAGDGSTAIGIRADGTAGTASIVIKTTTVTFPAKTVTFFASAAKTITVAVNKPVIGVASATDVIRATALDADGNVWGGAAYIYASTAADALIAGSVTPVACTFNTLGFHACPVAGTAAGTANFKVIDAATVALATATSASAAVRVTTASYKGVTCF